MNWLSKLYTRLFKHCSWCNEDVDEHTHWMQSNLIFGYEDKVCSYCRGVIKKLEADGHF